MWNLMKKYTNQLTYKTETDLQIAKSNIVTEGEMRKGRINREFGVNTCAPLHIK